MYIYIYIHSTMRMYEQAIIRYKLSEPCISLNTHILLVSPCISLTTHMCARITMYKSHHAHYIARITMY